MIHPSHPDPAAHLVAPHLLLVAAELRAQGHSLAASYRGVREGRLITIRRGVFMETETWNALSPTQQHSAHLQAFHRTHGSDYLFSHTSAAHLHGWALLRREPRLHISGDPRPGGNPPGVSRHHLPDAAAHATLLEHGLPATTVVRTLADCLCQPMTPLAALILADSALHHGTPADQVRDLLETTDRCHGVRRALAALSLADPRAASPAESFARHLIHTHGLPRPELQVLVPTARGRRYLDLGWPQLRLGLEVDGHAKYFEHGPTAEVVFQERQREKDIMAEGWHLLRTDWPEMRDRPTTLIRRLSEAIILRRAMR